MSNDSSKNQTYSLGAEVSALELDGNEFNLDDIELRKKELEQKLIDQKVCPNCHTHFLVNQDTGELIRVGCKRYDCPVCGKYKAWKLKKALESWMKKWPMVRMMTLTYRTSIFANAHHCALMSSKIIRYFTTYLRRHKKASNREKGFQYVRFAEFTKNGFLHYHLLVDRYIRWSVAIEAWNHAIHAVMKTGLSFVALDKPIIQNDGTKKRYVGSYVGSVNFVTRKNNRIVGIDGNISPKTAASYVTKYVVKACSEFREKFASLYEMEARRFKLWTKSSRVALFTHNESKGNWKFIIGKASIEDTLLNLVLLDLSSQEISEKIAKNNRIYVPPS